MVNERKIKIVEKLCQCFTDYKQVAIVTLDNVSTNQLHNARKILNAGDYKGDMNNSKNTLIKKALKFMTEKPEPSDENYDLHKKWNQIPELVSLIPLIKGNVGLIFSEEPYSELRVKIEEEKISMPARTGIPAPCDVIIPDGPTGVEVGKIDLFHKLNISCKTVRSAIEVVKPIKIITKGEKVGEGATQMCKVLNIIPFSYAIEFKCVYNDGVIFDQEVLGMNMSDIVASFTRSASYVTSISVGAGIPNALSVPHFLKNGFKALLAIGVNSDISFKELDAMKNAAVAAPVETAAAVDNKKADTKKAEVVEVAEEDSESVDCIGMFDED